MFSFKKVGIQGLTLVELLMVVLLLAVLAAIAIPNFIDFRKDSKNGATFSAVSALRSSLAMAAANIQLKEGSEGNVPKFPTLLEMQNNQFSDSHPALKGTTIIDARQGMPNNPWTLPTLPADQQNKIFDCPLPKGTLLTSPDQDLRGWCYNEATGEIWANTNLNGAEVGQTENSY